MIPIVPLARLVDALETVSEDNRVFLNRETGEVILVSNEDLGDLESDEPTDGEPEWRRDMLEDLRAMRDNLISLPDSFEIHEWSIMERFARAAPPEARDDLQSALHGRGAFRAFKDELGRRGLQELWYEYRGEAFAEIARDWAKENGIHVTPRPVDPLPPDP